MAYGRNVAVLTPFPVPTRVPLFNAIARSSQLNITFLLTESKGVVNKKWNLGDHSWDFKYEILPAIAPVIHSRSFGSEYYPLNPTLLMKLLGAKYDVVVSIGWTALASIVAFFSGKFGLHKSILWEDSSPHAPTRTKRALTPLISRYIGSFDAHLATSRQCKRYLTSYGARPEGVFVMPFVIDFDAFRSAAAVLASRRADLRRDLGIAEGEAILYVGQLIERKGVLVLLDAFSGVVNVRPNATLLVAGMGQLENAMKRRFAELALPQDSVRFLGYVPQEQLLELYAASDAFVLPSYYDAFGAVVLEAMVSGLPVVATSSVGASYDLIEDGGNGFIVPPGNAIELRDAMIRLVRNPELRAKMRLRSSEILGEWNIERATRAFVDAIEYVCRS